MDLTRGYYLLFNMRMGLRGGVLAQMRTGEDARPREGISKDSDAILLSSLPPGGGPNRPDAWRIF